MIVRTARVLVGFMKERRSQNKKWGPKTYPDGTGLIGDAERAKHAKVTAGGLAAHEKLTWRDVLYEEVTGAFSEKQLGKLRMELRKVGATAAAWIEDVENRMSEIINDKVDEWHKGDSDDPTTLAEYLGMTEKEYSEWVISGKIPDDYSV